MDPQAALYDLLSAMANGDRELVDILLEGLQEWNQKEGWLPQFPKDSRINSFLVTRK
jgi:hypothetical protein